MSSCLVCHRALRKEPSLSRGIGPACAKKVRGLAGLTGTGGKAFSVVGDEYWDKFIADHAAIRERQAPWEKAAESIHIEPEGSRIAAERIGDYTVHGTKIRDQKDLATMFQDMSSFDREKCFVACCDEDGNIIGTQCVSVGTINASFVVPRDVLKVPFLLGAKKFYLLHNHPSGDANPSSEDLSVTKRIHEAATSLGIDFAGHAVIGDGE